MPDKAPDGFLGGGPKFNSVGNHPTGAEEAPIVPKSGMQPHQVRKLIAAIVVVALVAIIYTIADIQYGSTHHVQVRPGGGSSIEKPGLDVDHP